MPTTIHDRGYETMRESLRGGKATKKLDRAVITAAENGFTLECSYRSPKAKGPMMVPYQTPVTKVFQSANALLLFLREALGE